MAEDKKPKPTKKDAPPKNKEKLPPPENDEKPPPPLGRIIKEITIPKKRK